jgi:predicted O-methyltransferase YrrM
MSFSQLWAKESWVTYQKETIAQMQEIPGWCNDDKALMMMNLVKENKFKNCIEIGVFAGKSLLPIAKTLQRNSNGRVYAIDCWDPQIASKGYLPNDPNYSWWSQLDYENLHKLTINLIDKNKLQSRCILIKQSSQEAVNNFADNSIDFIHFDGNHNEDNALLDVELYLSKLKDGGYILLNDPNWYSMKKALVYLLERSDIVSQYEPKATFFLFRRNKTRELFTKTLINE